VNPKRTEVLDQKHSAPRDLSAQILEHDVELVVLGVLGQLLVVLLQHGRFDLLRGAFGLLDGEPLALNVVLRVWSIFRVESVRQCENTAKTLFVVVDEFDERKERTGFGILRLEISDGGVGIQLKRAESLA
jgi:hypothetical protein